MVSTVRNADVFVGALPEDMPPFDCANGSIFFDMTTGKSYFLWQMLAFGMNP